MVTFTTPRSVGAGRGWTVPSIFGRRAGAPSAASAFARHQTARAERLLASDPYVRLARQSR